MKYILSSTAFLTMLLFSCSKHKGDVEEHIPSATINFTSPVAATPYQFGDSVVIQATAISTEATHGYDLIIRKLNDTTQLYFEHVNDHSDTILVNRKWKNSVMGAANMEAQIILYLDHDGHTGTKKAAF